MLEKFIDAAVRGKLCRLCCFKVGGDEVVCSEHTINREWLKMGMKSENYDDEDYLKSLRCYEVEDKMLEIITKIYALSTVGLSKDEIIKNLKKKYNEDDIKNTISFLKNNNLIEEYLGIPYKNEVIIEIRPRDINCTDKKSKKFYTAELYYTQNIAKIDSKTPEIYPSYRFFNIPYFFYISSNPLCFIKEIPKYKWDVDLLSTNSLCQWIHFNIIDRFMPEMCVIETRFVFECWKAKSGLVMSEDEMINHKDGEAIKEKLLKILLKKIRSVGGKNIVIKNKGPFNIDIKYMLHKEIVLPIAAFYSTCYGFPKTYGYLHSEVIRKDGNVWELRHVLDFAGAIRKRKKAEENDYFFINDESEDFDDIVIGEDVAYTFPCDFKAKFIDYVAKKLRSVGAKINIINKFE